MELPKPKSDGKSNKRKLQYNPENPGIESCSKVPKIGAPDNPVYVPTPKNASIKEETIYEDIINCKDLKVKDEKNEKIAIKVEEVEKEEKPPAVKKNGHLERRNSSTSSTSTSSRHKSSKEKQSSKEDEEKSSKKSSSSSKSSDKSSKKSSSRDKDRRNDEKSSKSKSTRSKDTERSSSSSSRKDKKSSSRRDDKERSSSSRDKEKHKEKSKDREPSISIDVSSINYQSCEEDGVDEECRRIFEELKNSTKSKPKIVEEDPKIEPKDYEDLLKKKRVAHEGSSLKLPTQIVKRTNHTQNAMQAVYNRQEVLRKKLEKEQEAAAEKLRIAQDNLKKAAEEFKKSQAKNMNLTPLIPKSYLTPPTRISGKSTIAPIPNAIAFANARKKVDELIAIRKGFTSSTSPTMATTAAKGSARIAHNISKATIEKLEAKAPLPLESGSSKISFNLRMQYYNLMVKHCLTIYTSKEDAWQRAQNDELAAFKKCNTPIIYKSSALLAINKLKKEAESSGNVSMQPKIVSHEVILAGKQAQHCSWSVRNKM